MKHEVKQTMIEDIREGRNAKELKRWRKGRERGKPNRNQSKEKEKDEKTAKSEWKEEEDEMSTYVHKAFNRTNI